MNIFQRLVEGLLFYHPAAWWISSVIRAERENSCDDVVVSLRGDAHGYAVALTALEQNRSEQRWPTREPAVAATGGNLMKRVRRLLYPKRPSGIWAPALAALVLMASTAMGLAAWHVNPNPSPNPASDQTDSKVSGPWQKWLNEDVVYIISDDEKAAFERLNTDEEREQFVEQFWDAAIPRRARPRTSSKKNITVESHLPISGFGQHPARPVGRRTGAISTSCMGRQMRSIRTRKRQTVCTAPKCGDT